MNGKQRRPQGRAADVAGRLAPVLFNALIGCGQAGDAGTMAEPTRPASEFRSLMGMGAPKLPSLKDLGPKGRRVKVVVLPGDASVEVDGFVRKRTDGVIEIMGTVGEVHGLRVFKGKQRIEQDVTIQETGASPSLLDLTASPYPSSNAARESRSRASEGVGHL